jgi:transcriptional regulator with XRE-family HTH domain
MTAKFHIHPIKRWRFERGLTLDKAARRLKTSAAHLSEIERHRKMPSLTLAYRISDRTGLSLEQIVDAGQ